MDQLENRLSAITDIAATPPHAILLKLCLISAFLGFFAWDLGRAYRGASATATSLQWPRAILRSAWNAYWLLLWYGVLACGLVVLGVVIWSLSKGEL